MSWSNVNPFPNGVQKLTAGSNITVTGTVQNPTVSASGAVASITAGSNISVSADSGSNYTISASGGGGPVYINNYAGGISTYALPTTQFQSYILLSQPNYSLQFTLPRKANIASGTTISIQLFYNNSLAGLSFVYNGSNSISPPATYTNGGTITWLYTLIGGTGYWYYQTTNTPYISTNLTA